MEQAAKFWKNSPNSQLEFNLKANLSKLFDSDLDEEKEPGVVTVTTSDGSVKSIDVSVKKRGNTSLKQCKFKKLNIIFKSSTEGTPFEGINSLQLGTHCDLLGPADNLRLGDERVVAREYIAYAIADLLGVPANKARRAKISYIDEGNKFTTTQQALLVEDHDDAAARLGGRRLDSHDDKALLLTLNRSKLLGSDAALQHWFELLVANSYFTLSDLTGTCSFLSGGFYNTKVYQKPDGSFGTFVYDFDVAWPVRETKDNRDAIMQGLAGMTTDALAPGKNSLVRYVSLCAQYARMRHLRTEREAALSLIRSKKGEIFELIKSIAMDEEGRSNWLS